MIDELNTFIQAALQEAGGGQFRNIVTTTDNRFANFDAHRPAACWAIRPLDMYNINLDGSIVGVPVRIMIIISDHNQGRATEKMIALHRQITGTHVEFEGDAYAQEDLFALVEGTPEVLVNLPKEYSLGIEYQGTITVDTEKL